MKVKAVIGANYGDEGKGLMTDYFVRKAKKPLVVRFNGGAQAGHTVNDGKMRHVCSHFGSGILTGAPTFLAKEYVINPYLFCKELEELQDKNVVIPPVYIDPGARVTTFYDTMINRLLETSRASDRHGSVGVGFGETIEQSERYPNALRMKDLLRGESFLIPRLVDIEKNWFNSRMNELGLENNLSTHTLNNFRLNFIKWTKTFLSNVRMGTFQTSIDNINPSDLIFEGAQGLLLNQNGEDFPHVTRSNTGLENVHELLKDFQFEDSEAIYVSRSYMTRHGSGPLVFEFKNPGEMGYKVFDETNKHGSFQGTLRFAPLDIDQLFTRTNIDFDDYGSLFDKRTVAVTCVDQLDKGYVTLSSDGDMYETSSTYVAEKFVEDCDYISLGPTFEDVMLSQNLGKIKGIWD